MSTWVSSINGSPLLLRSESYQDRFRCHLILEGCFHESGPLDQSGVFSNRRWIGFLEGPPEGRWCVSDRPRALTPMDRCGCDYRPSLGSTRGEAQDARASERLLAPPAQSEPRRALPAPQPPDAVTRIYRPSCAVAFSSQPINLLRVAALKVGRSRRPSRWRTQMPSIIKSLTLAELPARSKDPLTNRRNNLLKKLEDQAALAANPDYVRVQHRWTGKGDARRRVEKQTSVKPWWREDHSGRAYMTIRVGQTPLEFEKGKAAIVTTRDELSALIARLRDAIASGEADSLIARVPVKAVGTKKRKAA